MSGYSQPGVKRQKVREPRPGDSVDYFQGIDKVEYSNMAGAGDAAAYRYYSGAERVHARAAEDWLKLSVSLADFRHSESDIHNRPPHRPWDDGTPTIENHKRCIRALFEFCSKLGVRYWTAMDSQLVGDDGQWDEVVEYVQEMGQRFHVKLLWLAPDLHSHIRYTSGAFTSNEAPTFAQAATQIKKCLEISQRLNAECFLLWPYREGYESILQSDVSKEIKLFAKLLKLTAEYKDRLNYGCQLLIMPYDSCHRQCNGSFGWQPRKWRESDMLNKYMWDVTSCLYLLKSYNLDRSYKVCSPPGHHMVMANVYNMLGGVAVTNDVDHYDTRAFTLMMKTVIDQGAAPPGGISLQLRARRSSDPRELLTLHVKYIDAVAKGLRFAASLSADQTFSKHLQQRYASYTGFGARLASSDVTMEECEEFCKKKQNVHASETSKPEHMEHLLFQRYLDTSDHI